MIFFKEGIYVVETDFAHKDLIYKRLDGIGDKKTEVILEDFKTIIKEDNQSYFDVYFQYLINDPRVLKGLNITQSDSNAIFILDKEKIKLTTIPKENYVPKSDVRLLRFEKTGNYWCTLIDEGKILYFNYQDCDEQQNKPFEIFNNELFYLIEKESPKKLIIDL